jgi:hypothetical protein
MTISIPKSTLMRRTLPKRPWHSVPNWHHRVTGDEMVAAMDKVGVDGAIFISAFSMYRYDARRLDRNQSDKNHRECEFCSGLDPISPPWRIRTPMF